MIVHFHHRVTPSIKFPGSHIYTWVERGTLRVKCLAHEQNTMSSARARTLTTQSGGECTNHEANVPITACKRNGSLQDIQSPNIIGHSFHGRFRRKEGLLLLQYQRKNLDNDCFSLCSFIYKYIVTVHYYCNLSCKSLFYLLLTGCYYEGSRIHRSD